MYSQLIYFIVALLLFSVQQPGADAQLSPLPAILIGLGTFAAFCLVCRASFRRLTHAAAAGLFQASLTMRHHRLQSRLSILALALQIIYVYVLDIKFYLTSLPFFKQSETVTGMVGLALFLFHLSIIWFLSYPIYKEIHRSSLTRAAYFRGQLGFSMALLIPWLLISLLFDLMQSVKPPAALSADAWQLILSSLAMGLFVFFAPRLVVRLWGCETMPDSPLRAELEGFCSRQGFSVGDFKLWPILGGEMLTAGIMGILPKWRYILITRGLLRILSLDELKAVVAHEMGHVRRYHLPFFVFLFACYSLFTYSFNDLFLLFFLKNSQLLGLALSDASLYQSVFSLLYLLPILLMLVVYLRYVFGFFLRNCERQADLYALQVIGHPFTLISSLEKIAFYGGNIHDLPSWHHYSIRQRMDFLLQCHRNPLLVRRHNFKLYGAALVFVMIIGSLMLGVIQLKDARLTQNWKTEIEINLLERELLHHPDNAELHAAYGGVMLELGRYREAESSLRKAVDLAPDNASTLNNLAWLYATAPPPHANPEAALELAREAARRSQEPHILDTLAEALYVNGLFAEAIEAINEALAKNPANKDYFLKQKQKFESALQK